MKIKGLQDTIDWYNANAEYYAQATTQNTSLDEIDQFIHFLHPNDKILDAGCGSGRDTNILSKKGFSVIGVDISSGILGVARKTYPTLTFTQGDLRSLPFENASFNGIWAHASLLHLETSEDVNAALCELYRVLKPKGIVHILVKAQTGEAKTAIVKDAISQHDRFFQYFTKQELNDLLVSCGFDVLQINQYKETDKNPLGRPEVEWILVLAERKTP